MRLGVRGKLFWTSVALIVAVGLSSTLWLEGQLRDLLEDMVEARMESSVHTVRDALLVAEPAWDTPTMHPLVSRLGEAAGMRISVMESDGTVVGDSALDARVIGAMDNHGQRPERLQALQGPGVGWSRRYSHTLDTDMLYAALRLEPGSDRVVRVAMPLSEVDEAAERLRGILLVAGLIGLALALFMSAMAAHLASRALTGVVARARRLTDKTLGTPSGAPIRDELGLLEASFQRMATELDDLVGDLAEARDRFQTVLDGMDVGVIGLDELRKVSLMNAAARELLQITGAATGWELVHLIRDPSLHKLLEDTAAGETRETDLHLPVSPPRTLGAHLTVREGATGSVLILYDVTELRQLETVRRDFVANVSHELRTPVSVVSTCAETLLGGAMEDPEHGRDFVKRIARNSERLSSLIDDLLVLARLEGGEEPSELQGIEIHAMVADLLERYGPDVAKRVDVEVPPSLQVLGEPSALEQALGNLLDNAVKYTPEGGTVWVRTAVNAQEVIIEVEDEGPGIEAHHRERVFERFYRADPGRARAVGGTGLGLSIVKHAVTRMGGAAGVRPRPGGGSVFWIELSLASSD